MVECPDCHSTSVQSKGYRIALVHRYICNICGRNFQIDNRPKEELPKKIQEEVENIMSEVEKKISKRANMTLNVTYRTKERVENLKIHERETVDEVINRLLDEHYNKVKDVSA